MLAMVLRTPNTALVAEEREVPTPGAGQLLLRVGACAVCRTDLHVAMGELPRAKSPIVPGHEIVGVVERRGPGSDVAEGTRVGVTWLAGACGVCRFCLSGRENLCAQARFTGCDVDGGFAEYVLADERFCLPLPPSYDDLHAAPLLCAGVIGHRALSFTGDAERLGIYGFGAAGHLVLQVARHQGRRVFAFTSPGDVVAQAFARSLGAEWAGDSTSPSPEPLDAAILFAPVGALVPQALRAVERGGVVVCGGIHMSDIPSFPYELLWGERTIRSVANLTRADARAFVALAPNVPVTTRVQPFALTAANEALDALKRGKLSGAAVLVATG